MIGSKYFFPQICPIYRLFSLPLCFLNARLSILVHVTWVQPGFREDGPGDIPMMRYCAISSLEHGHRSAITDLLWVPDHFEVNRMGVPIENKMLNCCQIITAAADKFARI